MAAGDVTAGTGDLLRSGSSLLVSTAESPRLARSCRRDRAKSRKLEPSSATIESPTALPLAAVMSVSTEALAPPPGDMAGEDEAPCRAMISAMRSSVDLRTSGVEGFEDGFFSFFFLLLLFLLPPPVGTS